MKYFLNHNSGSDGKIILCANYSFLVVIILVMMDISSEIKLGHSDVLGSSYMQPRKKKGSISKIPYHS